MATTNGSDMDLHQYPVFKDMMNKFLAECDEIYFSDKSESEKLALFDAKFNDMGV